MRILVKIYLIVILFVFTTSFLAVTPMLVRAAEINPWGDPTETGGEEGIRSIVGLGSKDPRVIAAGIINTILGFLGIIAVVMILFGGFKWMTAGGNQDNVEKAKEIITAAVIGLVIILAAFGIANFVINNILKATSD